MIFVITAVNYNESTYDYGIVTLCKDNKNCYRWCDLNNQQQDVISPLVFLSSDSAINFWKECLNGNMISACAMYNDTDKSVIPINGLDYNSISVARLNIDRAVSLSTHVKKEDTYES